MSAVYNLVLPSSDGISIYNTMGNILNTEEQRIFISTNKNGRCLSCAFLDALASLDLKLSLSEWVSDLPFFKLSVIPVIPVIPVM